MRILSARASDIRVDRLRHRVEAVISLRLDLGGGKFSEARIPTCAPISSSGGAPLKARLIASAKLILALSHHPAPLDEAIILRPAA